MDVYNNVLEGTRQYFLGVPKPAQSDDIPEEGAPAQSGAPAHLSRPPSTAAAPSIPSTMAVATPPRPPSEPIEPEPHIIHKATVMREAEEKRREHPEPDEDEEPVSALSPPSHIIRKPPPQPSPAPAPAAPCPSPARPPSEAPFPPASAPDPQSECLTQYRPPSHRGQTPIARPPDPYAPTRPPDHYTVSRPPEPYPRFHYDLNVHDNCRSPLVHPSLPSQSTPQGQRYSPHYTYTRLTNSVPQHAAPRLRDTPSTTQCFVIPPSQHLPPHNDRVPPIHHPQTIPPQRLTPVDTRSTALYSHLPRNRESSSFGRTSTHYERPTPVAPRKYDPQQPYPGYRPTSIATQPAHNRQETYIQHRQTTYDVIATHYGTKPTDRMSVAHHPHHLEASRSSNSRSADIRRGYHYNLPSTSNTRCSSTASLPVAQNSTVLPQTALRAKAGMECTPTIRSPATKSVNNQPQRMIAVTTIVNEMNQSKQKRESPLDLSTKTVKNSADSTAQDDLVDSASSECKSLALNSRPLATSRQNQQTATGSSLKVDFLPNFNQCRERSSSHNHNLIPQTTSHPSLRCNGAYDSQRRDTYSIESRHQIYQDRDNYRQPMRTDYPRIDLTRTVAEEHHVNNRLRDERNYVIEGRKRPSNTNITNNIPEKMIRYETWPADSRSDQIDRMNQFVREQNELIRKPVYSYVTVNNLEPYQNEQKRPHMYNENSVQNNRRYPYQMESPYREPTDFHPHYHDRIPPNSSSRNVIQKNQSRRDYPIDSHNGVPADKRVLSILKNSLESKQTGSIDSVRQTKEIPDLIVIDDVDDPIIEIADDNDVHVSTKSVPESLNNKIVSPLNRNIQMPKAIDSISHDSDYNDFDTTEIKSKSPENDVASRIRTKAELKVMPPSQDSPLKNVVKEGVVIAEKENAKLIPKSQKQHLFNQIREDSKLEYVIKNEKSSEIIVPKVKSEPMNIEEIEKDANTPIKTENIFQNIEPQIHENEFIKSAPEDDLDWVNACDSFVEQLKIGCHRKRLRKKHQDTLDEENETKIDITNPDIVTVTILSQKPDAPTMQVEPLSEEVPAVVIKQEPIDEEEIITEKEPNLNIEVVNNIKSEDKTDKKSKEDNKQKCKISHAKNKNKLNNKCDSNKTSVTKSNVKEKNSTTLKTNEFKQKKSIKTIIKEEVESTDDDEPLIKSKILKDKEESERLKHQLLRDLSEKSAYVKLECCDIDLNKNNRKSLDLSFRESEEILEKNLKVTKSKNKFYENNKIGTTKDNSSSDSDDELSVASRLRTRKSVKGEELKTQIHKSPIKTSLSKRLDISNSSSNSASSRKPGFGDANYFHPGWEEELYRYKRSLRMPTRLIAIPRGSLTGRPCIRRSGVLFTRGSTSLPDLDPAPLSPAPSSAPSAATDDLYARRQDKLTLDSDLDSNSSCSVANRLQYDSEASTSTIISTSKVKKKASSIVDVLIEKCGKKDDLKRKFKDKEDKTPKIIKNTITSDLLPTPSVEDIKGNVISKKEKSTDEKLSLKAFKRQSATIKEVFGDERPASAPPSSRRVVDHEQENRVLRDPKIKNKLKAKRVLKGILQRRSSSLREGLRSDKLLKKNDHKSRLLRIKKRNNLMKNLAKKKLKDLPLHKHQNDKAVSQNDKAISQTDKEKDESNSQESLPPTENVIKKRFKRLFGRRKLSSGFDYIRKKKKIIRREENAVPKFRRPAFKPSPESVHDIQKEIKGWFINKSIGETHLHRATRLGYTDCVAYCLEKMEADPSAKDNAGFTPLHVASARGHVRIARLLLQYGADVSAAAQGGIRPLHEACENCHLEVIRLLLAYGADPLLVTYADQTPEELAEGPAALLIRLHIADVQGRAIEPWRFPPLTEIIDCDELGCDPLSSPPPASPPPPPDSMIEIQTTEAPLPPFYSLRSLPGQPMDGLWCLLQDITNLLQIKSKDSLLKQIHCGSGSPKELLREIRTQEFLERAQCHQLLCAGEKVNVRASKVALVRVTDKLRQLLKIETVLVS